MKRRFLLTFFGVALYASCLMAQQKAVTGKVVSSNGEVLSNVTVLVKGTDRMVQTNADGTFSIQAAPGETLVFRMIGSDERNQVVGAGNVYNITLQSSDEAIDEVVVTAMGIKQRARSLGYSAQNVSSKELTESNQPNLVNTLQGKVAGVQVTNSGGSPGTSASIYIRGGSSLSGNNQPLFVVDGIPIDNSTPISQGGLTAGVAPASNRAIDINPEDIASISVLKGPAASALYGLRAASGAVIITTKRGNSGKGSISYGNTFSWDKANKLPELQGVFKQGRNGIFENESYLSWGPEFASNEEIYDNLGGFFKTGFAQNHDLSASGGSERSTFYVSGNLMEQGGIAKNNDFSRRSFRLNADHKIFDNLKIGANMTYMNTGRTYFPQGSENGVMGAIYWPRNVQMTDFLNEDGTQKTLSENGENAIDNPYWTINKKPITNRVNRVIAMGDVNYNPYEWLTLTYRLGTDYYGENFQSITAPTSQTGLTGYMTESKANNQLTTSTFLANAKQLVSDFNFDFTVGHNIETIFRETNTATARNFIDPDFASINNVLAEDRTVSTSISRRRIVGVFGDFTADWKNIIYLNLKGRNDWTSTLRPGQNSFFYPAVSTSIVLTDLMKELSGNSSTGFLSYAKLRAAWAQVGKDAPAHKLATTLGTYINDFTINPRGFISNMNDTYGNPNLVPEFTNSLEFGADLKMFNNRIGLDVTWYKTNSDNQILSTRTPPSSGSFLAVLNGGEIENVGWEGILNVQAVKKQDFSWSFDVNFSKNKATVLYLPGFLDRVELSDAWVKGDAAQGAAFLNSTLFGINGKTWKTNDAGQYLLDNNGMPQVVSTLSNIGDRNPDWIGGITNNFQYKNLGLSFMWDVRQGGDVFNATAYTLVLSGLSPLTLDRGTAVIPGIIESTGATNTTAIPLNQDYYTSRFANNGYNFVEDGSWIRLRYVSLSYKAPASFTERLKLSNLQFTLTGRNLLLFTDYSGVDPEVSGSGAGVAGAGSFGFDNLGVPATRGFDLGLKFSF